MYFNFNFLKPLKLREIQVLKFGLYIYIINTGSAHAPNTGTLNDIIQDYYFPYYLNLVKGMKEKVR